MLETDLQPQPKRHPVISLIIIFILVVIGFLAVGPMIGIFFAWLFYPGGDFLEYTNALQNPTIHPEVKMSLYVIQGFATAIGLILIPAWYMRSRENQSIFKFFGNRRPEWIPVLTTTFIVIIFMAVNSVFIEWNANVQFPEFARGFERWAREREDTATQLTEFLTHFESPWELLPAILVIAILPAIGEEIVFRGMIQGELLRATRNIHVAIWLAAILFSAFHIQFFGFVPRMLLGALFGYLYYWSGSLSFAVLAHFVNNGVSVIAVYLYQQGSVGFDLESPEAAPAEAVIISALLTVGLLYSFYKYFEHRKTSVA